MWCVRQVVSEDGKKVRRVQPLPDVDLEEVQVVSWLELEIVWMLLELGVS